MRRFAKITNGKVEAVFEHDGDWPAGWPAVVEIPDGEPVIPENRYENGAFVTGPVTVNPQTLINSIEGRQLLPRAVREFMLAIVAERAVAAGQSPTTLPAYVKLKALDDQIAALRRQL